MKRLVFILLALCLILVGCGAKDPVTPDPNEGLSQAYSFKMKDIEGNEVTLKSLNDKPIILNFWASWCPPCKAELGDFEKMYKQYGNKINFVMLSVDEAFSDALAIAEENGYTFPIYHDAMGEGSFYYSISSIPQTYFINSDGYITKAYTEMITEAQLKSGIDTLLK